MHDLDSTDTLNAIGYQPPLLSDCSAGDDNEAAQTVDRRRPHAKMVPGEYVQNLNGKLAFLEPHASSTSESDESSDDDNPSLRVQCRHLAFHYCVASLNNPTHAPSKEGMSTLRRLPPDRLEQVRQQLHQYSRAVHIVCARDFGLFLRQRFNDMLADRDAPTDTDGLRALRGFYISTGCHALAMRLACWQREPNGPIEHEVSVYDPNCTNLQVQCFVDDPCDFIAAPQAFNLLSFLLPRGKELETWHTSKSSYFELWQNPVLQVKLYEVDVEMDGLEKESAPLRTNWSGSHRASLYQLHSIDETAYRHALSGTVAQAVRTRDAARLLELPGFDNAVLVHLLSTPDEAGLAHWRELWQKSTPAIQVELLRARTHSGDPWGFSVNDIPDHLLGQWADMLGSMQADLALRVMNATDSQGRPALALALRSAQVLRAVDPVLRRCAETRSQAVADLLTGQDLMGQFALASAPVEDAHEALAIWLGWLREWVPVEQRGETLLALDSEGKPAIARAMKANALAWIDTWAKAVADLPAHQQAHLLTAWDHDGHPALLHAIRAGKAAAVQAWGHWVAQLPGEQRAEALSGEHRSGWALLTQPWCEPHTDWPTDESVDERPGLLVQAQHAALQAWLGLLQNLDVPARLDLMAGCGARGVPAWLHMASEGLNQEIQLLIQAWERLIPPEHRTALIERLGFDDPRDEAHFLEGLANMPGLHRDIASALTLMADWAPPALASALNKVLSPH